MKNETIKRILNVFSVLGLALAISVNVLVIYAIVVEGFISDMFIFMLGSCIPLIIVVSINYVLGNGLKLLHKF